MSKKFRGLLLAALVAVFGLSMAGSAFAQDDIPIDAPEECVEMVLDLPALPICKDKNGLHLMDLPAIGILREPAPTTQPAPAADRTLPRTGMHVEDFAAIGLAALAGGAVLLRRLRLAVA
jgi:LPXTG-motif cell wall-anchored protein